MARKSNLQRTALALSTSPLLAFVWIGTGQAAEPLVNTPVVMTMEEYKCVSAGFDRLSKMGVLADAEKYIARDLITVTHTADRIEVQIAAPPPQGPDFKTTYGGYEFECDSDGRVLGVKLEK
jgi:predicted N-formylglutamate amidohydrolase